MPERYWSCTPGEGMQVTWPGPIAGFLYHGAIVPSWIADYEVLPLGELTPIWHGGLI